MALRRGQRFPCITRYCLQQVGERRLGQRRLRRAWLAGEDAKSRGVGSSERLAEQRGLAYAGIPGQDVSAALLSPGGGKTCVEDTELLGAPDEDRT